MPATSCGWRAESRQPVVIGKRPAVSGGLRAESRQALFIGYACTRLWLKGKVEAGCCHRLEACNELWLMGTVDSIEI